MLGWLIQRGIEFALLAFAVLAFLNLCAVTMLVVLFLALVVGPPLFILRLLGVFNE